MNKPGVNSHHLQHVETNMTQMQGAPTMVFFHAQTDTVVMLSLSPLLATESVAGQPALSYQVSCSRADNPGHPHDKLTLEQAVQFVTDAFVKTAFAYTRVDYFVVKLQDGKVVTGGTAFYGTVDVAVDSEVFNKNVKMAIAQGRLAVALAPSQTLH
jgi:hypothetical protein